LHPLAKSAESAHDRDAWQRQDCCSAKNPGLNDRPSTLQPAPAPKPNVAQHATSPSAVAIENRSVTKSLSKLVEGRGSRGPVRRLIDATRQPNRLVSACEGVPALDHHGWRASKTRSLSLLGGRYKSALDLQSSFSCKRVQEPFGCPPIWTVREVLEFDLHRVTFESQIAPFRAAPCTINLPAHWKVKM
jgi:hypothetical protein